MQPPDPGTPPQTYSNKGTRPGHRANPRPSPYPGPRPFQTGQRLYGRDYELRLLLDTLIAERIVLFFSPSGAGKTSLIQAGLIPCMQERNFYLWPIARVNLEPPAALHDRPGFNRYTYSLLRSLEEAFPGGGTTPDERLSQTPLEEVLGRRPVEADAPHTELLIFDQFEELLTLDPTDLEEKAAFLEELGDALRDRRRWALFAMREDYVAGLEPYLDSLPTRLSNTVRLDLLGLEAALEAMQKPAAAAGVEFGVEAARRLAQDLSRVQVQGPDGVARERPGRFVEPVQLQVVCDDLWDSLGPDDTRITEEDLAALGEVDQSLARYYAGRVQAAATATGVPERAIREWVDRRLITPQGLRGQALMGAGESEGLDNRAVRFLEDAHLIRGERRRGVTWYELVHDRLVGPIRGDNAAWYRERLSLLQRQAARWAEEYHRPSLLLRSDALEEAEKWAQEHPGELTDLEAELLKSSQAAREKERQELAQSLRLRTERQMSRLLSSALRGLAAGAVGFVLVFWIVYAPRITADLRGLGGFPLVTLVFGTVFQIVPGALAGAALTLSAELTRAGFRGVWPSLRWAVVGLAGAAGFSLALLAMALLLQASWQVDSWGWRAAVVLEGGLWGFSAGLGLVWALDSPRPIGQKLLAIALACGLFLWLLEVVIGAAFRGIAGPLQVVLAGAALPLSILASTILARQPEDFR